MGKPKESSNEEPENQQPPPAYIAHMLSRQLMKYAARYDYEHAWNELSSEQKEEFTKRARDASPPRKSKKKEEPAAAPAPKKKKDPKMPKNPRTGYIWFNQTKDPKMLERLKNPPEGEKSKDYRITVWRGLTAAEKAPYLKLAEEDKKRYDQQMQLFKEGKFNRTEADKLELQEKTEKAKKEEKKQDERKKKKKKVAISSKSSNSSESSD